MSVEIVQGEDKVFSVKLTDGNGNDYDLTGFTELTAEFAGITVPLAITTTPDANGSVASANPLCGKIEITLTDVATLLLESGDSQDLEITIDKGTDRTIVQLTKVLKVKERLIS